MTWMLTATGREFNLQFVDETAIAIEDIAHHLAMINRYTGAAARPFSVAEHSLLVVEILERDVGVRSPHVLMYGLMHDAHEAYTNDLSSPMKRVIGEAWRREERRIEYGVLKRFGLLSVQAAYWQLIHEADITALVSERAQLLPIVGPQWEAELDLKPVTWWKASDREAFTWKDWRQAFLDKFAELSFARGELKPADAGAL